LIDAGFEVYKPQGAFYIFVKSPIKDELNMIEHLKKYHILAVPGVGFGKRGYFRLSYAVKKEVVERSIPLFKKAMEDLKYLK
jgi:aspartate aminotransferase